MIARLEDGVIIYADPAFCALYGLTTAEVIGHTGVELGLIAAEERELMVAALPADGSVNRQQSIRETPHGRRLVETHHRRATIAGDPCWIVIVRDITDQAGVIDERNLLRNVLDAEPTGFVLYDRELRILRVNDTAEKLTVLRKQHVGQALASVTDVPQDRLQILQRVLDTGEAVIDREFSGATAGPRWLRSSIFPVFDDDGAIIGCAATFQDVTERRRAESRRREIIETSLDAIVTMDTDGVVLEWNPAAEAVFGYPQQDAIGRTVETLIVPPDQRADHRRGLTEYMRIGHGPLVGRRVEVEAMRLGGEVFPAEVAITASTDAADERPVFTAHVRDVSERLARERQLREMEQHRRAILASMLQAEEAERAASPPSCMTTPCR